MKQDVSQCWEPILLTVLADKGIMHDRELQ
jgi:hypothetical protein